MGDFFIFCASVGVLSIALAFAYVLVAIARGDL